MENKRIPIEEPTYNATLCAVRQERPGKNAALWRLHGDSIFLNPRAKMLWERYEFDLKNLGWALIATDHPFVTHALERDRRLVIIGIGRILDNPRHGYRGSRERWLSIMDDLMTDIKNHELRRAA